MQNDKIVVGLDIGTTKICAIVGAKNEYGKLEVLGMGKAVSDGVIRGIVTNIDKTVLAIEKAIAEASEQSGIEINVVNVGIAGQHIKSSVHHGSITRDRVDDEITVEDINRLTNDIHKIVMPPGCEIIHVMPQDYIVDYEDGIKTYQDLIKIEPTEVYSSAILIFDFEPAKEISYDLVYDSMTMNGSIINKGEGKMVKKVDFSLLKKGTYSFSKKSIDFL